MEKKTIAVIGATGLQGKGVINALLKEGSFKVRAITRNPDKYNGNAHEVVQGDLTDLDLLTASFKGAHGVFVVTNFWEGADEIAQGKAAVEAAKNAEVDHFIWSTLPNVEEISKGQLDVPHFTGKAKVDEFSKKSRVFQLYLCSSAILLSEFDWAIRSTSFTRWLPGLDTSQCIRQKE